MRRRKTSALFKDKSLVIAAVLCVLAIAGLAGVGIYSQSNQPDQNQNLVDLNELPDALVSDQAANETSTDTKEAATENVQAENYNDNQNAVSNAMDATDEVKKADAKPTDKTNQSVISENTKREDSATDTLAKEDANKAAETEQTPSVSTGSTKAGALNFSEKDKLDWPVSGNILVNYSMDKTVYFATLNQYKYNPALIIQAKEADKVVAAANGKVTNIATKSETGLTLTMDMGNGYTCIYGQLKNLAVEEGDKVEKGSVIGYISKPSKYYSVEGSNLYFQLLKNNNPVNPMNYLE